MTLSYLSGNRIQGSGFDKDYATFSDNFGGSDAWSDADSAKIGVNTTTELLDITFVADSTNDSCSYDLTSTSDTAWVLRFKVNYSSFAGTAIRHWYGLSSHDSASSHSTTQDFIGWMCIGTGATNNQGCQDTDGATLPTGTWDDTTATLTLATGTDYYIQIKRTSATAYNVSIFSDSNYSILLASWSGTCASTTQTLRYIVIRNENDTRTSSVVGTIDNVKFWNGVTSANAPLLNLQNGARFEETDTELIYSLIANPNILDEAYTTNAGWTTQAGTTITVDSGTADKLDGTSVPANADHRVSKSLDGTLSDSLWIADFELNVASMGVGTQGFIVWFSAGIGKPRDGVTDGLGAFIQEPAGTEQIGIVKSNGGTLATSTMMTLPMSTLFYCRLERTSTTNARLSVFTDAVRTTHQSGSPINYTIDSTITTLTTLQHSSDDGGGTANTWSGTIDNMKVYNGVSQIPDWWVQQ